MTDNTPEKLYRPRAAMELLDLKPSSFYELIARGVISGPDIELSPRRPRWRESTLKKVQDKLAKRGREDIEVGS
jgi:predicted DNA-binding transcriptional regulator AlpA